MRSFYFIIFLLIPGILLPHHKNGEPLSEIPNSSTEQIKVFEADFIAPAADCNPLAEFTEDFNSTDEGEVPDCWNTLTMNSSSGNIDLNVKSNPNAITPPNDFQFNNSTDDNATFYLVTPELSTLADGTHRLRFYYDKNGNSNVQVEVGTMSNASSANTFNSVASISPGEGYNVFTVDFDEPTTDSYVAFKLSFSIGFSRVYLDNVSWEPISDCAEPTDLSFDDSGETTADLSWNPGEDESNWTVKYGEQGFDLETAGQTEEVSGSPEVTLSDLTVNTQYQAYIKAVCAEDEESVYAGPINFYTGYCPGTAQGGSSSIDNFTTTGGYENIDNQNTGYDSGYEDYTDMMVSQTPGNDFNFSASTVGSSAGFAIYIDYNQDYTFDSSEKVYTSNGYETEVSGTINIPADTAPGEYRLRVVSNWLSTDPEPCHNQNNGEIEDYTLIVLQLSECTPPENLILESVAVNTADISWAAGADETQWEIKYGEQGFDPDDEGSSQIMNDDPETTLIDLNPNTTYQVYLRALCEDSESMFTPPLQFTTACEATNIPFVQDFEDTTPPALPDCGKIENAGSGNNWETHHLIYYGFNSNVLRYKYSNQPANAWYFTQGIILETETAYQLKYKYGNNANTMFEKLRVSYGTSPESSAMETELANHTNVVGQEPEIDEVLFTVEEDGVYYFGFNAHSDADQFYLFVDDIEVDIAPTCPRPTQIEVEYIADTFAHISWTPGTDESAWEVIYGEEGFDPDGAEGTSIEIENQDPQAILDNLNPDSTYDIYVKAICAEDDESDWSNSNTFTTKPASPENNYLCDALELEVDAPCTEPYSNVDAFAEIDEPVGSCLNNFHGTNSVWFTFTAPESGGVLIVSDFETTLINTEMVVYEAPEDCQDPTTLGEEKGCADNNNMNLEIEDLIPGEVYYLKVAGFNNEAGDFCIEIQTDETPSCAAPTNITFGEITQDTAEISWTAGGNETQWEVIYGEAGFNPETAGASEIVNTTEVLLTELTPETDYEVYVRAICIVFNSDLAGPEIFTTEVMSVDSEIFQDFKFHPNPVKNQLTLKSHSPIEKVEVYNLLGQNVINIQPNSLKAQISTETLQTGMYLMKVSINGSQKSFRVVKK